MKTLYLIRHAKSSWKDAATLSDAQRPLNERGKRDAPFMGKVLHQKRFMPDLWLSSPAVRALKTARIIAEQTGADKDRIVLRPEIYEASPYGILSIVQGLDDAAQSAVLFGHNPAFTEVVNWYADSPLLNLPTCGIAAIEFPIQHWNQATYDNGRLLWVDIPKNYLPGIEGED